MDSAPRSQLDRPHLLVMGPYPDWDMQPLEEAYVVHRLWEAANPDALIADHAAQIRAIATRGELGASAAQIAALPALEIIACYGVGVDRIDLDAARRRGIRVTNTPDVLTGDVADMAIGLTLAVARRIPAADGHVRSGSWANAPLGLVTRVHGKKIGIVGLGRIGTAVAMRFAGFDMAIGYFDRTARPHLPYRFFAALGDLAQWADFLVVTLSGGPTTDRIVNAAILAALGPDGYLINVSRGSTVDEPALLHALENGVIAGAALDVFWNEPAIDRRFFALSNTVLQPHHSSGTVETRRAMGKLVRDNLTEHFARRPLLTPVV